MAAGKLKPGTPYTGAKSIQTIDGVTAHYAELASGPLRLVDTGDGFVVAGPDDPVQTDTRIVELEVEDIHGTASTEA